MVPPRHTACRGLRRKVHSRWTRLKNRGLLQVEWVEKLLSVAANPLRTRVSGIPMKVKPWRSFGTDSGATQLAAWRVNSRQRGAPKPPCGGSPHPARHGDIHLAEGGDGEAAQAALVPFVAAASAAGSSGSAAAGKSARHCHPHALEKRRLTFMREPPHTAITAASSAPGPSPPESTTDSSRRRNTCIDRGPPPGRDRGCRRRTGSRCAECTRHRERTSC